MTLRERLIIELGGTLIGVPDRQVIADAIVESVADWLRSAEVRDVFLEYDHVDPLEALAVHLKNGFVPVPPVVDYTCKSCLAVYTAARDGICSTCVNRGVTPASFANQLDVTVQALREIRERHTMASGSRGVDGEIAHRALTDIGRA